MATKSIGDRPRWRTRSPPGPAGAHACAMRWDGIGAYIWIYLYSSRPDQIKAVGYSGKDRVQADLDRRGSSRQIDDQALSARPGRLPGEMAVGTCSRLTRRINSPKPSEFARDDHPRCFRRQVTRRRPGAAGGQDKVAAFTLDHVDQRLRHAVGAVGNNPDNGDPIRLQRALKKAVDGLAANILIFAAAGAIGYRQYANSRQRNVRHLSPPPDLG